MSDTFFSFRLFRAPFFIYIICCSAFFLQHQTPFVSHYIFLVLFILCFFHANNPVLLQNLLRRSCTMPFSPAQSTNLADLCRYLFTSSMEADGFDISSEVTITPEYIKGRLLAMALQLGVGPADTGAPFHYHSSAINSLLVGRKLWLLYPPSEVLVSKLHPMDFLTEYAAGTLKFQKTRNPVIKCIQEAGDQVFVSVFPGFSPPLSLSFSLCHDLSRSPLPPPSPFSHPPRVPSSFLGPESFALIRKRWRLRVAAGPRRICARDHQLGNCDGRGQCRHTISTVQRECKKGQRSTQRDCSAFLVSRLVLKNNHVL